MKVGGERLKVVGGGWESRVSSDECGWGSNEWRM
jgi:hypothetical protein